jgi:branched-chain amino acid transport system ATP-binding protein
MNVVMAISDKITVLHHGEIIAEGSPEYVKRHKEVVRAYLGEKEYAKAKRHSDVTAR